MKNDIINFVLVLVCVLLLAIIAAPRWGAAFAGSGQYTLGMREEDVWKSLGAPGKVEKEIDGSEKWIYPKVTLWFIDGRLRKYDHVPGCDMP